jgi:hypothetical protein
LGCFPDRLGHGAPPAINSMLRPICYFRVNISRRKAERGQRPRTGGEASGYRYAIWKDTEVRSGPCGSDEVRRNAGLLPASPF